MDSACAGMTSSIVDDTARVCVTHRPISPAPFAKVLYSVDAPRPSVVAMPQVFRFTLPALFAFAIGAHVMNAHSATPVIVIHGGARVIAKQLPPQHYNA